MHKNFYASGFLYFSPTQKILLLQTNTNTEASYTLFSGTYNGNVDPASVFQKTVSDALGIELPLSSIVHVYDYTPQNSVQKQSVYYADVSSIGEESDFQKKGNAAWFTQKQLTKLKLPQQIDHDIMIGQRVIRANSTQV